MVATRGGAKPISSVVRGDEIATHSGEYARVYFTHAHTR